MPNVNALSISEIQHFNIKEGDKPFIKDIRSVYCYDPSVSTHLCELTPSHSLRFLYTYVVLVTYAHEPDVSDERRDELDERYCYEGGEDIYWHVSDVRQFAKHHPAEHKECGAFDSIEDACEYLNGNCPF